MRNLPTVLLVLLIGAVILSGCDDRRSSEAEAGAFSEWIPVPSNASFVVSIRVGELLADPDVASIVESISLFDVEPLTLDGLLSEATEEVGIDFRRVDRIIVFGDLDSDEYLGVLIEGDIDQELFLAELEALLNESPSIEDYKGYELHVFSDDGVTLVWLDPDTVLAASSRSVMAKDVIDVVERDAEPASGPMMGLFGTLGEPWVKGAFKLPAELASEDEVIISGLDLSLLTEIQLIGFVVDKVQSEFNVEVSIRYPTEERAEEAAEVLNSLVTLIDAFTDDGYAAGYIDRIEASSEDTITRATYSITVEELLSAFEEWTDLLASFGLGDEFSSSESVEPLEIEGTTDPTDGAPQLLVGELYFQAVAIDSREHIPVGQAARSYSSNPPTSGPHWSAVGIAPTPWGIETDVVPDEALVHNLEHGGIVIHYQPTAPPSLVDQLVSFVQSQPNYPNGYVLAPRETLPATITLSAWEYYLPLFQFNEQQMRGFISAHYDQGPETLDGQLK